MEHPHDEVRQNPLLGPKKDFPLPGDVTSDFITMSLPPREPAIKVYKPDTSNNISIQDVLNASELSVQRDEEFRPESFSESHVFDKCEIEVKFDECPKLLRKDLNRMFVDHVFTSDSVCVINIAQKSIHDMVAWNREMETEREALNESFIHTAKDVCELIQKEGYWADFIDPMSGRPYYGGYTNCSLFETDERYMKMGFKIEDLGCCKVIKHMKWGTHVFVGSIFTEAPTESAVMKEIKSAIKEI
uniref:Methylmalonic aciduria and homocystinuria type D protein, mitochondrial n=1 Tax=Rhabditophanes sp. KR3021 TaxID=114890 RepID=A0AC35TGU4_9BILA